MKVYNLHCEHDHRFEGWFSSAQDFQGQLSSGRIACPVCESCNITKLPSAPRVLKSQSAINAQPTASRDGKAKAEVSQHPLTILRRIVEQAEDVGDRFAEEARRMHYAESPERPIRGVASADECHALADEGIEVLPLPSSLKQPLQ